MRIPLILSILSLAACGNTKPDDTGDSANNVSTDTTTSAGTTGTQTTTTGTTGTGTTTTGTTGTTTTDTTTTSTTTTGSGSTSVNTSIDGRWIPLPYLNTMYWFNGTERLTYFCPFVDVSECDDAYWFSLGPDDAVPRRHPYTFDGETLWINLFYDMEFEEAVAFQCDGDAVLFVETDAVWHRVGGDVEGCD